MNGKSSSERLGEALERARSHWQRVRQPEETAVAAPLVGQPPVVALSREAGTNGGSVARALGQRLGWPVYDRELLQLIAAEMGLRTKLVESVDEKRSNWLRECLESFSSVPTVSANAYVRHLTEIILALATHGECVIVGRGAAHMLPSESTFRVRLTAPRAARIERIEQRFGISQADASRWIDKTDRERSLFVKEFFQKDAADPHGYDLVLNTGCFSSDDCAAIILEALKCWRRQGQTPRTRPRPSAPVAAC